jgi:hypothetical protein
MFSFLVAGDVVFCIGDFSKELLLERLSFSEISTCVKKTLGKNSEARMAIAVRKHKVLNTRKRAIGELLTATITGIPSTYACPRLTAAIAGK